MIPLLLAGAAMLSFAVAVVMLQSFGSRYRVGRLLAAVPAIPLAEAIRLAEQGANEYVRVDGRIDSEEPFEDDAHRPLVLRRTSIEWQVRRGRWVTADTSTEVVPFVIREGLDEITVDVANLTHGLVVVPRQALGVVADLGERAPAEADPAAPARLTIEQVSSVEHGTVLGVPVRMPDGQVRLGAGRGRPLILSTLEGDEAMRVLAGGDTRRARIAIVGLVLAAALLATALAWWVVETLLTPGITAAASPAASFGTGSDTRSSGEGPGLVGDPVLAIGLVVAIAIASVLGSLAYVRLTGGRRGDRPGDVPTDHR